MSSIATQNKYVYYEKQKWRDWIMKKLLELSNSVYPDGKLLGKLLEPVGVSAECFNQRKFYIPESDLIGIDIDIDNINQCKKLFPLAHFYNQSIEEYCISTSDYVKYIIYDVFTALGGKDFDKNINSVLRLTKSSLSYYGQVFLVINSDVRGSIRHGITKEMMIRNLEILIKNANLPKTNVYDEYEYQNTKRSSKMYSVMLVFSN